MENSDYSKLSNRNYTFVQQNASSEAVTNKVFRNVYLWMFAALAITGVSAWYVAARPAVQQLVFGHSGALFVLIIAELALVIGLSAAINKMSAATATLMFALYAILNGVTLSSIFLVYQLGTIAEAFFVAAGMFAFMAVYGSFTKKDLTKLGSICLMAVFGMLLAFLVNVFMKSPAFDLAISGIAVLVFVGLTAYDAQKIKQMLQGAEENEMTQKIAVLGALSLYLDFINIFLYLLRFFGRRD